MSAWQKTLAEWDFSWIGSGDPDCDATDLQIFRHDKNKDLVCEIDLGLRGGGFYWWLFYDRIPTNRPGEEHSSECFFVHKRTHAHEIENIAEGSSLEKLVGDLREVFQLNR